VANAANGEAPLPQAADSVLDFGLSTEELAGVDESLSGLDDYALASVSASAIGALASTGDLSKTVARYAEATGLDPSIAEAKVLEAAQPFYTAGGKYLSQVVGLPESDHAPFLEYCQQNEPAALREAFESITKTNNYRSLGKLVRGFMNNTVPSLEALDNHGIPHREVNGRTQVQLNGQWLDLKAARKAEML
jgi:hypothetical protein